MKGDGQAAAADGLGVRQAKRPRRSASTRSPSTGSAAISLAATPTNPRQNRDRSPHKT
jgi:hypothetical protein